MNCTFRPLNIVAFWFELKVTLIEDSDQVLCFGCLDDICHDLWPFIDFSRFSCDAMSELKKKKKKGIIEK